MGEEPGGGEVSGQSGKGRAVRKLTSALYLATLAFKTSFLWAWVGGRGVRLEHNAPDFCTHAPRDYPMEGSTRSLKFMPSF